MHRSGTSALAGVLHFLGVDLGTDLIPPGPDNPKGFWEYGHVVAIHLGLLEVFSSYDVDFLPIAPNWMSHPDIPWYQDYLINALRRDFSGKPLWGFKDPRLCRLMAIWPGIFDALGAQPRFAIALRHPDEVAASLYARSRIAYNPAVVLWLSHMLEAERHTRGRRRVVVTYDGLMSNWRAQAERIATGLAVQWPADNASVGGDIDAFLDPGLRHNRAAASADPSLAVAIQGADPRLAHWAFALYHALCGGNPDNPTIDEAAVDRIRHEFNLAIPSLMRWRLPRPAGQRFTTEYQGAEAMVNRPAVSA
jgi:hypothetical protein